MSDFSYKIPSNFDRRVEQLLRQKESCLDLPGAFKRCHYEYEDKGLAYYAGMRGDNWDKHALDFIIEGDKECIGVLTRCGNILKDSIGKALKPSKTGLLVREVDFLESNYDDFLPSSNEDRFNADMASAQGILKSILEIGERLCSNASYTSEILEDRINDYLRDGLSLQGYTEVKDQSRHGLSANGNSSGEVDILLSKNGREVAIIECMKLSSVNTSYIDAHVSKTITNYNPLGSAAFIIAYVSAADYKSFCNKYFRYLIEYPYQLQQKKRLQLTAFPNASTRVATMVLSRDGYDFPVYFITFKLIR